MEDISLEQAVTGLFENLKFVIIPNGLSQYQLNQYNRALTGANGAVVPFDTSNGRIDDLEKISYIISQTSDFPDYYRALDLMIHVVEPSWIEASLKLKKIKNPRTYSPDPALFMHDVIICCGNIPSGDKEAIEGGVLAMGGQYSPVLSKIVTHLVALDMSDERCQLAISKGLSTAIVLPHWFDDCLRVGRRISERPYILPDPEILNTTNLAIAATRTSQQIRDATTPDPTHDPIPPATETHLEEPRAIKAFAGKHVKLGEDLGLNDRLKTIITGMIWAGGGQTTDDIAEVDIYVCKYRSGADYVKMSQAEKDVGNLSWLYYLITHNIWTNPMRRLLHYPRPPNGIPGFEKFRVSISSYTGEARVYLENLVKASGAEFTKTFKQENTHLVTAHKNSEKCEAAIEWGVNVVNHLWLEDSYANHKLMPLTDERYNYFPPKTNFGEILGQTEIDRDAMEKLFFAKGRKLTKAAKPGAQAETTGSFSRVHSDQVARSSPVANKAKRSKTTGDAQTPLPTRHIGGKENQTPGSRGAKNRALSKIQDAAPDIAKFEKEMRRRGGVIHGGRRSADDEVEEKLKNARGRDLTASKRSFEEVEDEDEDDETEDEEATDTSAKNKRMKKDKLTPIKFRMLVSKDDRWTDNDEKASSERARLRELGLLITDDFKKVDLLCAPKPVRTKKFVAALACGPTIVSTTYLDYAIKHNKLPPPEKHRLNAKDFEETNGFCMDDAIARAKRNKHRLLKDWTIFCTQSVGGGFDTYKEIIEANGGRCFLWKGRSTNISATKRSLSTSDKEVSQNQEGDEGDVLYLISDPEKKEMGNWVKFREMAAKHDMISRIVKTEWILYVAMAQYVHWNPEWELCEKDIRRAK